MSKDITIIFTGDTSFSGSFENSLKNNDEIVDQNIKKLFSSADYIHINLENPITNLPFRKIHGACLRAPPKAVEYISSINVSICNLANNHILDCGRKGLTETISYLNKNNIRWYGLNKKPFFVIEVIAGVKLGLISSMYKTNFSGERGYLDETPFFGNLKSIKKIIKHLKDNKKVDYIIYNYHGDTEFNIIPEPYKRNFFHELIDLGIDIIVGHHPHVPQGIEKYNNSLIFYSLGNLFFDLEYQNSYSFTDWSYFIKLNICKQKYDYDIYFYEIDKKKGAIKLADQDKYRIMFNKYFNVFQRDSSYIKNWNRECSRLFLKILKIEQNISLPKFNTKLYGSYVVNFFIYLIRKTKRPFLKGFIRHCIDILFGES